jgi:hypothetical protein
VGNAFRFVDSAESYILLPNTPAFQPASNQLTIAAWVKPDFSGTLNLMDHIIAKRDACGGEAYSYSFAIIKGVGGYPTGSFGLGMLPQIPWIASTNRIPDDGQFHHVAVTYNGDKTNDNCVLYLDGQIAGGGDGPGTIPVTGFGPTIGRLTPCGYYSKMDLDELAFFDRELSSAEIQAIFAASSAGMCPPQCVSPPSDLVGWWPGEGHFFDLVGGNHGVPLGNVTFAQAEVGRGFRFNGDGSAIFIPPSPATDVGAQAGLTVEAWLQRWVAGSSCGLVGPLKANSATAPLVTSGRTTQLSSASWTPWAPGTRLKRSPTRWFWARCSNSRSLTTRPAVWRRFTEMGNS